MQVFASHAQFKDWFSNPLTGMVEGQEAVNKVSSQLPKQPSALANAASSEATLDLRFPAVRAVST